MTFHKQTIYKNGRFRLVPKVTLLVVQLEGRDLNLPPFRIEEIEQAISEVDRMAEEDGVFSHAS